MGNEMGEHERRALDYLIWEQDQMSNGIAIMSWGGAVKPTLVFFRDDDALGAAQHVASEASVDRNVEIVRLPDVPSAGVGLGAYHPAVHASMTVDEYAARFGIAKALHVDPRSKRETIAPKNEPWRWECVTHSVSQTGFATENEARQASLDGHGLTGCRINAHQVRGHKQVRGNQKTVTPPSVSDSGSVADAIDSWSWECASHDTGAAGYATRAEAVAGYVAHRERAGGCPSLPCIGGNQRSARDAASAHMRAEFHARGLPCRVVVDIADEAGMATAGPATAMSPSKYWGECRTHGWVNEEADDWREAVTGGARHIAAFVPSGCDIVFKYRDSVGTFTYPFSMPTKTDAELTAIRDAYVAPSPEEATAILDEAQASSIGREIVDRARRVRSIWSDRDSLIERVRRAEVFTAAHMLQRPSAWNQRTEAQNVNALLAALRMLLDEEQKGAHVATD